MFTSQSSRRGSIVRGRALSRSLSRATAMDSSDSDDDKPLAMLAKRKVEEEPPVEAKKPKPAAAPKPPAPKPSGSSSNSQAERKPKRIAEDDDSSDADDAHQPVKQEVKASAKVQPQSVPVKAPAQKAPAPKPKAPAPKAAPVKKPVAKKEESSDEEDESPDEEDSSEDDVPLSGKKKRPQPAKPSPASKSKQAKPKPESSDDEEEGIPQGDSDKKWYESGEKVEWQKGQKKWTTLEWAGVVFPPLYEAHGVEFRYDGKPVQLTSEQEEVATMYASMLETAYAKEPVFQKNFMESWRPLLKKTEAGRAVKKLELCEFSTIKVGYDRASHPERKSLGHVHTRGRSKLDVHRRACVPVLSSCVFVGAGAGASGLRGQGEEGDAQRPEEGPQSSQG